MSKLPTDTRLEKLIAEDPEALARLMTRFMGDTVAALSGISFSENMKAQWHEFEITVPDVVAGLAHASAYRNAAMALAAGVTTRVNFDSVTVDNYDSVITGASWEYDVPAASRYLVTAAVTVNGIASGQFGHLDVYVNGAHARRVCSIQLSSGVGAGAVTLAGSCLLDVLMGDSIDVRVTWSGANGVTVGQPFSYVEISEQDTSGRDVPIPDSCWPYDFLHIYNEKPRAVLCMAVSETGDEEYVEYGAPDWTFYLSSESKPVVRIRNIPGLTPGRTYRITLLVLKD